MPKYPNINVQLVGMDGNCFMVLARVVRAMRDNGVPEKEIDAFKMEAQSGDYNHLLCTVWEWVETDKDDTGTDTFSEDFFNSVNDDDTFDC